MKTNLRSVLLVASIALGCGWALAGGGGGGYNYNLWHMARIKVVSEPTGAGLVYATTGTTGTVNNCTDTTYTAASGRTQNTNNYPQLFYIFTKPANTTQYKFDHWECKTRVGDILEYNNKSAANVGDTKDDASTSVYVGLSKMGGTNTGNKSDATEDLGIVNAIWVAHYVPIHFFDVTARSNDNSLGSVELFGPEGNTENKVGDEVTLKARTENYYTMFRGWKRNGEWVRDNQGNIIRDVPYTFTVTEENKGEYVAQFEGGYQFLRIKNRNTGHYLSSQTLYNVPANPTSQDLISALSLFELNDDLASSLDDQGTIARLTNYPRPGSSQQIVEEIEIRGFNTNQVYKVSDGQFLQIYHDTENAYDIGKGVSVSFHIYEDATGVHGSASVVSSMNYLWDFEGIDKDLTTKENYYTPDALIQGEDGMWYGTHRASWNTKYDTEQITAYVVTGVTDDGSLEMTEVTGGIIPKGMAVLLKCKTNDPTLNVMIPTLTNATFTASSNLLTTCENYYPQQSVNTSSNYKALGLINGRIGFGGSALNKVDGNHGYMQLASDVLVNDLYPEVTLAELLASGDTQNTYVVTDLTAVEVVNDDQLIIAKDDNGYATKDVMPEGGDYVDYMHMAGGIDNNVLNITVPEEYDQSNWIALRVPAGASLTTNMKGKHLTGVKGRLVNTANPEFVLDKLPDTEDEGGASTALNVFIPASFKGTQPSTVGSQKDYFFVQPKPMEMANITWAQWDGEKFISPVHSTDHPDWNQAELVGSFELNGAYLEARGGSLDMSTLKAGHAYAMTPAVVKLKTGNYDHVYVLGTVNGLNWDTNKGVEMETTDGTVYTAIVTANNSGDGYDYFSFTKELGTSWEAINASRFGSEASGSYWDVLDQHYNTPLTLRYWGGSTGSFRVPEGTYRLTVTLADGENYYAGTVVIQRAGASQAPRRKADGDNGYVVYPISMTQITSEENNVVTGVSTVGGDRVAVSRQYVNVAGVRASQPWNGVNIVITTYSDGTTTATKIVK